MKIEIKIDNIAYLRSFDDLINNKPSDLPDKVREDYLALKNNAKVLEIKYEIVVYSKLSNIDIYASLKNRCIVCKEKYVLNDSLVKFDCNHFIHSDCYKNHFENQKCPYCSSTDKFKKSSLISMTDNIFKILKLT